MAMTEPDMRSVVYREGPLTADDYAEAIADLERATKQDECRSMCCSVCEDTGHTAEHCHHNPLVLARRYAAATKIYVCFHCGYEARNEDEARAHFGATEDEVARCIADRAA